MSETFPRPDREDAAAPDWKLSPERSNPFMLRFMCWISLRLGRRAARGLLYGVAGYFLLFSPRARQASHTYLRRVLPLPPGARVGWGRLFRHFMSFASVVHDRIYLINDQFDLFDIALHQRQLIIDVLARGRGAFLLGAHLGSFEVMRALGRQQPGLRVVMVMYEENARKINALLAAVNPAAQQDVVALGHVDSMMAVHELLEQGAVVGILGDRSLGHDAMVSLPFLGAPASLPVGPFRMAAILRRPVLFMAGLYRGGNRYDLHFETVADFSTVGAGGRDAAVHAAMTRYAQLLEQYCRAAPYNWFNFFDFWKPAPGPAGSEASARQHG
ncbi:MAG TPA: acyl-CoA synthetase [Rhodoferax sp.]|jgi:predicted LPLAT superfamily acyltransferase|nr:acyl-CoA synthetase [Rhodoferax sp.]